MKLSEAALLCEGTSRPFSEVYKLYNFKDDDDLRAYCDFVIHEPVEWMRGFPAAWKSATMFSKPRAAFHRLMKLPAVVEILGTAYCENVHEVVWNSFKAHMNAILEKRGGGVNSRGESRKSDGSTHESDSQSVPASEALTADSFDSESIMEPVPPVPAAAVATRPKNTVVYTGGKTETLDYKHKYEVLQRVLSALLTQGSQGADEASRLRAAFAVLLSEYGRL
jgi:hypothetical protein